eukprot:368577_1
MFDDTSSISTLQPSQRYVSNITSFNGLVNDNTYYAQPTTYTQYASPTIPLRVHLPPIAVNTSQYQHDTYYSPPTNTYQPAIPHDIGNMYTARTEGFYNQQESNETQTTWMQHYTIFYWAWWIAWA